MERAELIRTVTAKAVVIRLAGEIDQSNVGAIANRLDEATAAVPPPDLVILDLSEVSFLSAAGTREVRRFAARNARRGVRTRLVIEPVGIVHRILALLPPDSGLSTFDTVTHALCFGAG